MQDEVARFLFEKKNVHLQWMGVLPRFPLDQLNFTSAIALQRILIHAALLDKRSSTEHAV